MIAADRNLGLHQGARRILELDEGGLFSVAIAAGAFADGSLQYGLGFTHFLMTISATTPISTTLDVRIVPMLGALQTVSPASAIAEEFPVAVLATAVGTNLYSAYWGEARGLVVGSLGTGSTFCFTPAFFVRVRNTGAQPATGVSTTIVCA